MDRIRVAVYTTRSNTRPTYGYSQSDGSLIEEGTGNVIPAGQWFRSRQAGSSEEDEQIESPDEE